MIDAEPNEASAYGIAYAEIVERIYHRYGAALSPIQISVIVATCLQDLAGSPRSALPELTERLAAQRVAVLLQDGDPS